MRLSSVDLPEPEGPMSASNEPLGTSRSRPVEHAELLAAALVGLHHAAEARVHGPPRDAYEGMEDRLVRLADLTVVSSPRLLELRKGGARSIVYVPHGVDLDWFERSSRATPYFLTWTCSLNRLPGL